MLIVAFSKETYLVSLNGVIKSSFESKYPFRANQAHGLMIRNQTPYAILYESIRSKIHDLAPRGIFKGNIKGCGLQNSGGLKNNDYGMRLIRDSAIQVDPWLDNVVLKLSVLGMA